MASCLSPSITQPLHRGCCRSSGGAARRSAPAPATTPQTRAFTVRVEGSGQPIEVTEDEWTCGSDGTKASLQLGTAPAVEPVHVKLTQKTRRRPAPKAGAAAAPAAAPAAASAPAQVFLTALANVDDGVLGDSRAWLDGTSLRPGVQYVLGSGQRVEIGAASGDGAAAAFVVEFSETSGRDPLVEMMMQGMAGGGSAGDQLRDALK